MKFRLYFSRSVGAALVALLSVLFGGASSFGSSYFLEGQDTGTNTNWLSGNLTNWQELQYIPCRFRIEGGPLSNNVTLSFPGITASTPGFDGFFDFTNTANVVVSQPVLSAPASGAWSYSFTINVTDGNSAAVYFKPRLAAGAHANVGSALKISPTPSSAGELQIHKPSPGAGLPDLAIVKTGPAFVPQGGTITYTLTYTNKATSTNIATGVQATDFLPPNVVVDPSTLPTNATLVGNTLEWDLPDVPTNSGGQFTFQAKVPLSTPIGTVVSNFVQILDAEDDANTLNNTSSWLTTVTNGCVLTVTTPPSDQAACAGGSATFTVAASGAALTYQWYQGSSLLSGQNGNTLTVTNVSVANVGAYKVVVTDGCGNSVTNSANLTLNAPLVVTGSPSNATNCPGTTAMFSASATGTGVAFQWYKGTNALTGQTGNTLTLTNVTAASADTYSVVISDVCGDEVTNNAVLVVNQPVLVTTPLLSITNCPGIPASFTVGATGTGLTYKWYKGTTLIPNQTAATLNLGPASAGNAGTYSVVVSDLCGDSVTNNAVLVVNQTVLVTVPPSNLTNCPGTPASFSVTATGTGLSYQWYKGATAIPNQNGPTLNLGAASAANAGTYSVVVRDVCGDAVTNNAVLVVNQPVLVTTPPSNATECPGAPASFTVIATGTGLTYQWYQGTTAIPNQNGATLNLGPASTANAGTYSVVIGDICGDLVTNSATLTVNTNVVVTIPPANSTNCPGTTASFSVTAMGTGLTYQWYENTNLLDGQTSNTLTLTNVTATNADTYSVVVADACGGVVSNSAVLVVNQPVLVTAAPSNLTLCPGIDASFSVSATGTGLSYQWYQGTTQMPGQTTSTLDLGPASAANAGTYSVVVSDACGDMVTNYASLAVNQTVLVTVPPVDFTACPGTGAQFSIGATGTGLTYQWYKGAVQLTGQTTNTLNLSNVSAADAGTYFVVVSDICGDSVTNSANLNVNQNVLVTVPPSNSTNCPGTPAYFSVSATGTGLTYQWYKGATLLSGQTSNTLSLGSVSAGDAGTYIVVISDTCGGVSSNIAVLVVNQNVSVEPLPSVTENIGNTVTFTAVASGTGPFTYQWYKGAVALNGQTNSTLTLTNVQPGDAGTYSVTVMGACTSATSVGAVLTINLPPTVSIIYPTNGQVFVAPATFNVTAVAGDPDGTVTNLEIFSSTNGVDFVLLGGTNGQPYSTVVSNLPVGSYTFKARATDNLGETADSEPVTVSVVTGEGPTVTVLGMGFVNQNGTVWLTNVVCNPELSLPGGMKVFINGITNNTITVVNATGTSNGVPFVETLGEIQPGQCWTNIIEFHDPTGVAFRPILSAQLLVGGGGTGPVPAPPGIPQAVLFQRMLTSGTFLIEFATTNNGTYYVQYKDNLADAWSTVPQVFTGTGQHIQWVDSGPPLTPSLPSTSPARFYRVLVGN